MEIYVQSRGIAQDKGYCWVQTKADNTQQIVDEHELVKKNKYLIENESFSLVLVRDTGKLLLLITGIKATQRTDYIGRTILNSVAWVGEENEDNELSLRAIAIRALRSYCGEDSLKKQVVDAVESDINQGFIVKFDALKADELAKTIKNQIQNSTPSEQSEIGLSNEKNARKLIEDLEKFQLPNKQSPLVVFTGIQLQSALKEARVWRGYSSLNDQKKIARTGNGATQANKREKPLFILIISISLIALVVLLFIFQPWKEQPKPSDNEPKETPVQISPQKDSVELKSPTTLPSPSLTTPQPISSSTTESKKPQSEDSEVSSGNA